MKRLAMLSLLAFATGGAAAWAAGDFPVQAQRIEDRKAVFGTVESVDQIKARARIGGTVFGLAVDEGAQVTAGQRIAVVGDAKLQLQVAGAEQRLQSLQAQRELAEIELKRAKDLRASGAATQARVDDAQAKFQIAERTLSAMRSERQVAVEHAGEGAVLAPGAGRVLKVHVTDGSVVLPGDSVATIAAESYVLRLQLPERHARFIKPGDAVIVGAPALTPGAPPQRQGRVRLVYPEIEQGRVIADVEVDGLGDFFVGERVRVYVAAGARDGFVVPQSYIYRRFGLDYVRLADGTEVIVQPGQPVDGGIEILSGLRDGDVVVTP